MSRARTMTTLCVAALWLAACGPVEEAAPGDAATTTATAAPTTTTTTTLPAPEPPRYHLEPGSLIRSTATQELTLTMEARGVFVAQFGADGIEIGISLEGAHRVLVLPSDEPGVHQLVPRYQPSNGSLAFVQGGTTVTEDLDDADLDEFSSVLASSVVNTRGEPVSARNGAPGWTSALSAPSDSLVVIGPPLPDVPVDIGSSWTTELEFPVFGAVEAEMTVVDGEPDAEGLTIEYRYRVDDLPLAIDLAAAATLAGEGLPGALDGFADGAFGDTRAELTEFAIDGTAVFDPELGMTLTHTSHSEVKLELSTTIEGFPGALTMSVSGDETVTHDDLTEANVRFRSAILGQYKTNPFTASETALASLFWWEILDDSYDDVRDATDHLQDLFEWLNWVTVDGGDGPVLVFAGTNPSGARGLPDIATLVATLVSSAEPTSVDVGGVEATAVTVDGRRWLLWATAEHTFIAIGDDDAASAAMALLAASQSPSYRWQPGDCLDFETVDDLPYGPYGSGGVIHCNASHQFEVIHADTLPGGPDAAYPDDIHERSFSTCGEAFVDLFGATPRESSGGIITMRPDEQEWELGERYVTCVAMLWDHEGIAETDTWLSRESAVNDLAFAVGDCDLNGIPIACSEPHDSEIIGAGTYDAAPDAPYPDLVELAEVIGAACDDIAADFEPTAGSGETVEVGVWSDMALTWTTGDRHYLCTAFAEDDEGFPIEVTGTFEGSWEASGERSDV